MTVNILQTLHTLIASSVKYSKSLYLDILLNMADWTHWFVSDP